MFKKLPAPSRLVTVATTVLFILCIATGRPTGRVHGEQSGETNHTFGAFWQIDGAHSSILLLKNDSVHSPIDVQIIAFAHTGQRFAVLPVHIAKDSVSRVDLASIVGARAEWGGLELEFAGSASQLTGKVAITNSQNGARVELPLHGGYRYDNENAVYAPWWLPERGTDGRISLFNSSAASIVVSPAVAIAGTEKSQNSISLAPFETKLVHLRDLMVGVDETAGSIILRFQGPPHALEPALILENESTGLALAASFNARHSRRSIGTITTWQFPDVRLTDSAISTPSDSAQLKSYLFLSNGSETVLRPTITAYYGVDGRSGEAGLSVPNLAAGETRIVDLSQFVNNGLLPAVASHAALGVTFDGIPGDLSASIFTIVKDAAGDSVSSRADGIVLPPGIVDLRFWDSLTKACLLPAIQNVGGFAADTQTAIYYSTSFGAKSYLFPPITVAPGKRENLDLRHNIELGIPDRNGSVVPGGTSAGTLTLGIASQSALSASDVSAECKIAEACSLPSPPSPEQSAPSNSIHLFVPLACGGGGPPKDIPKITSISPTGAPFSTDASVTITGTDLDDPGIAVNITGGITATIQSKTATTIHATFDLGGETTVGSQGLFLSSDYGHSNEKTFEVGDPTPIVDSVTPAVWPAGATTPVTIKGSWFGTTPTVALSVGGIIWTQTGTPTDTGVLHGATVTGTVTVPACQPAQSVTVSVTSKGYSGSGFVSSTTGESSTGTDTASVTALAAPAPTISLGGSLISGTKTVIAGQQIALTGNVPSAQNACLSSQSWTAPTGTAIGGYAASVTSGSVTALPSNTGKTYTFYWVYAGTFTTTFKYTLSNGNSSPATTATFVVKGPTSGKMTTTHVGTMGITTISGGTYLQFGTSSATNAGVLFTPSATAPSGSTNNFVWAQIISADSVTANGSACPAGTGLDNVYPYPPVAGTNTAGDSPAVQLLSTDTTVSRTFNAQMYLMWNSGIANSIPVPLGSTTWGFTGTATKSGSTWTPSGSGSANAFVASAATQASHGYPTWTTHSTNGQCHSDTN